MPANSTVPSGAGWGALLRAWTWVQGSQGRTYLPTRCGALGKGSSPVWAVGFLPVECLGVTGAYPQCGCLALPQGSGPMGQMWAQ